MQVRNACNHHPAGTVADENDLTEVLILEDIGDVLHVHFEPDFLAREMRTLAEPRESWCEHLVAACTQDR